MQLGAHLASSEGFAEGHRLHRAQQRRQVVAHQHAHRPAGLAKVSGTPRQDTAHQPLPDRQCVVPGRPAGLRLCPHVESHAQRFRQDHHRLRAQMREDALPVRIGGHPARTPEDRPALHRNAGHERHSVRHRLHQGRQAPRRNVRKSVERYKATLGEQWEELPPMFVSSGERGTGREEILGFIGECLNV